MMLVKARPRSLWLDYSLSTCSRCGAVCTDRGTPALTKKTCSDWKQQRTSSLQRPDLAAMAFESRSAIRGQLTEVASLPAAVAKPPEQPSARVRCWLASSRPSPEAPGDRRPALSIATALRDIVRPRLHQCAPPLEQVTPHVSRFDAIRIDVGERQFADLSRCI